MSTERGHVFTASDASFELLASISIVVHVVSLATSCVSDGLDAEYAFLFAANDSFPSEALSSSARRQRLPIRIQVAGMCFLIELRPLGGYPIRENMLKGDVRRALAYDETAKTPI